MQRLLLALLLSLTVGTAGAAAQTQGFTVNLGGRNLPWPGEQYEPLRFTTLRESNAPPDALIDTPDDYAIRAWKDGWIEFTGNLMFVLDDNQPPPKVPDYKVRYWCNGPPSGCNYGRPDVVPLAADPGYATYWRVVNIPFNTKVLAKKGDLFRLWLSVTSNNPDGATTNYVDGNPAHTRLSVTMP